MSKPRPTPSASQKPVPAPTKPPSSSIKKNSLPQNRSPVKSQVNGAKKSTLSKVKSQPNHPSQKPTNPTAHALAKASPAVSSKNPPKATASKAPASNSPLSKSRPQPPTQQRPQNPSEPGNWISRTVQSYTQRAGDYAGGYILSVGDRVNKVGEGIGEGSAALTHLSPLYQSLRRKLTLLPVGSISDRTRSWGQGIAGYGNNMKDAVGVGGPRVATAGNPLGIAGQGSAQGEGNKGKVMGKGGGKASGSNPLGLS